MISFFVLPLILQRSLKINNRRSGMKEKDDRPSPCAPPLREFAVNPPLPLSFCFSKLPTVQFSPPCRVRNAPDRKASFKAAWGGQRWARCDGEAAGAGVGSQAAGGWVFFWGGPVYFINTECRLALEPSCSLPYGEDVLRLRRLLAKPLCLAAWRHTITGHH